jgi:hypothetical protein
MGELILQGGHSALHSRRRHEQPDVERGGLVLRQLLEEALERLLAGEEERPGLAEIRKELAYALEM